MKVAQPVELLAGDLLVTATAGTDVDAAGNRVHLDNAVEGQSAARSSRSLAVGATVYRGAATFDSAGQTRVIPALRTLEVSALGRPPSSAIPLKIDETQTDPWDRRFLGEAIDLGHTLANYSTVYTNTLGGNGATVGVYASVLPGLDDEREFTNLLLSESPPDSGEKFIGAAIASLSRKGTFADRWRATFSFRSAGASWGLVALDQGVARDPLLSAVENAAQSHPVRVRSRAPAADRHDELSGDRWQPDPYGPHHLAVAHYDHPTDDSALHNARSAQWLARGRWNRRERQRPAGWGRRRWPTGRAIDDALAT